MTRDEAETYFAEQIDLSGENQTQIDAWNILRDQAISYMNEGFDPDMVMFALKIAIEEKQGKLG